MALCMQRDSNGNNKQLLGVDAGKYVRYTPEQVEALERVYAECPKPSSLRRQQLIRDFSILSNIEPKQLKVWFQNRRCREKQKKESSRLQSVNRKLTAMNKLLMEENERLQKQVSHLVCENGFMRHKIHTVSAPNTDNNSDSVVMTMSAHQHRKIPTPQHPHRDANTPAGLLAIAEETMAEFLATGTSVDWVQIIGMKPGPDSIGIVAVSRNCRGVAARACGLVTLEPTKVAEILGDRWSWFRDCRRVDVASSIPTGNRGTNLELVYMQVYAPTTLASARDFWTLRYTTSLEDGSIVICERSLTSSTGGPSGPTSTFFSRAEMLPSGYLIRPCEGGGSIIHIVDHIDFDTSSVPEVLRPLYESSKILAQRMTIAALHHIRQISLELNGEIQSNGGRQPAVLRALSQRLCRGFNDAVNGFADDGWTTMRGDDGVEDVTISITSSPCKYNNFVMALPNYGGVLCAKASMLLQNVPPALLMRFLREHRSEWADNGVDVYSASSLKASPYAVPCAKPGGFPSTQTILPLAQTVENEEFLEVVRLEGGHAFSADDISLSSDMYLLQLCSGIDEASSGPCAQLVFAHIDDSFGDDAPLVTSGFRVVLLEAKSVEDGEKTTQTLDLASALDAGRGGSHSIGGNSSENQNLRSVLTIAFQFAFEDHFRDSVAAMARQYVRSVVASVQRVATAISPSPLSCHRTVEKSLDEAPEAVALANWICRSYRAHTGGDLLHDESPADMDVLKRLWRHSDAIMCCSVKMNFSAVFTFANQAGLDMLETTLVALQDIMLEKIFDEDGCRILMSEFPNIMQQGYAYLPGGVCVSSMGRPISYEQAVAWKVVDDEDSDHCLAFMFVNWSFV